MSTTDTAAVEAHTRRVLEVGLEGAWLKKCGMTGTPGKWWIPGELMEVLDDEVEVEVYPIYAHLGANGEPDSWSAHLMAEQEGVVHCWEWRLGAGWNDCTDAEIAHLEDMGGCFDDWHVDFMALGDHQEKPPIPDEVCAALAYLNRPGREEPPKRDND